MLPTDTFEKLQTANLTKQKSQANLTQPTSMESNMLCCILAFSLLLISIPRSQTLPFGINTHEGKGTQEQRIRFERETHESIPVPSTTPAAPDNGELSGTSTSEDSTTPETAAVQCDEETRQASSCRSLKERLQEYLSTPHSIDETVLQNAFTLDDLALFDLLGEGRPTGLSNTSSISDQGEAKCNYILLNHFRPLSVKQGQYGECSYNFSCSHDVTRFPALRIEANLINVDNDDCDRVLMHDVVYFERQECMGDPCRQENWVKRKTNLVVGYALAEGYES